MSSNNNDDRDQPQPRPSVEQVRRLVGQLADTMGVPAAQTPPVLRSAENANRAPLPEGLREPTARALFERGVRAGRAEMQREARIALNAIPRHSPPTPGTRNATPTTGTRYATPSPATRYATPSPTTQYANPSPGTRNATSIPITRNAIRPGRRILNVTALNPSPILQPEVRPRPLLSFQAVRPYPNYPGPSHQQQATPTPATNSTANRPPRQYNYYERRKRELRYREHMKRKFNVIITGLHQADLPRPTTSSTTPSSSTSTAAPSGDGMPTPTTQPTRQEEMETDLLEQEVEEFLSCPPSPLDTEPKSDSEQPPLPPQND